MKKLWQEFNNIDVRDYEALYPELFAYVREQMAGLDKQFLLIGDTNHHDTGLRRFLESPALAALFKAAAIPHVCTERPREIVPPERVALYREAVKINPQGAERLFWAGVRVDLRHWRKQYHIDGISDPLLGRVKGFYGPQMLGFTHAGLRMSAVDSIQWRETQIPGAAERAFLGDREVAAYIKAQVRNEKTAIIYGMGHFLYEHGMASRLGRENCLHIDFYADRESYEANSYRRIYRDMMPDRVCFLKERALKEPDPRYYCTVTDILDDMAQAWKLAVILRYGEGADSAVKARVQSRIKVIPGMDRKWFDFVPV